jgi:N6-adenosine-specific RNA methylase IME4
MTLPFHPLANIFPLIEGQEFTDLVASIKASGGPREPIILFEGLILDGRNRARACEEADVDPRYELLSDGTSPLDFVIDKNLRRRHLNESQRAFVAAKLANLPQGRPAEGDDKPANVPVKQSDAAAMLNVSERSVRSAASVQDKGTPELQRAVERGHLPVSAAAQATKLAPETQRKVAEEAEAGHANVVRNVIKTESRGNREKDLGTKIAALPDQRFGLIYVDIPRHFNVHSDETGLDRSPENHYATLSFEQLLVLPIPSIAADDCIIVFWSTAASLIDDIEIMAEWGFVTLRPRATSGKLVRDEAGKLIEIPDGGRYCSMQVWDKVRMGLGYWFRDRHEFILVAARGNVVPPAQGTQDQSLFSEDKREHSAKPNRVAEMIERLWPTLPKIELFRRGEPRPGWDAWGNQVVCTDVDARPDVNATAYDQEPHQGSTPGNGNPEVVAAGETAPSQQNDRQGDDHGDHNGKGNGSSVGAHSPTDDLEIPAFLRRNLHDNSQSEGEARG